ncbi:MAG: gamma-glutamyl-gamma-aminobutyrate hydrolase family protein [Verrucomicrobia bacterium]|nr:gamma-glutamyl-gamma-aminobutyrate hydrolase family protein [Verrucomicrobiota bacterium]
MKTRAVWFLIMALAFDASCEDSGKFVNPLAGCEGLFDSLERFNQETFDCVVVIDLTDPADLPKNLARPDGLFRLRAVTARMTALSGLDCYCFHYTQLKRASLNKPVVKAIIVRPPSPAKMLTCAAPREEFWAMLRETRTPVIGFCGGFHQIYLAFGGKCGDMRRLAAGETDIHPKYSPGFLKEWGFSKVRLMKRDPIFDGLGLELQVLQQHVPECKQVPTEFEVLASSDACRVQVIKHKTRLIYGTQFHPEAYDNDHPDGKRMLQNFFRLAGVNGRTHR